MIYGLVGYSPYFGSIDQIAPQWLELSILNIIVALYTLFFQKDLFNSKIIKSPVLVSLLLFTIWGLLSYFYAINSNEVLILSTRWFNIFVSLFLVSSLISSARISFFEFSLLISSLLLIEVIFSLRGYFQLINLRPFDFSFAGNLRGVTGNKNITSSSMAVKIPFLIYCFWKSKNQLLKLLSFLVLGFTYFNLILLSARAMYIAMLFINAVLLVLYISRQSKNFKLGQKFNIIYPQGIFLFVVGFSFLYLGKQNSANIANRIQTINYSDESTQQRIRFYKHALNHTLNHPIFGVGLGNWKIKSVDYDSLKMKSYIVPYHVHNDFLEISSELGFIGLLLYITPFVYLFFLFYKNLNSNYFSEYLILFMAISVYCIDAMLNFPQARVINQLCFIFIFSLLVNLQLRFKNEVKS